MLGKGDFQLKNVDRKMKENRYTVTIFAIIVPDEVVYEKQNRLKTFLAGHLFVAEL